MSTPRVGGYFEDETGWWQLEMLVKDEDGLIEGWFIGKKGQERFIPLAEIPELRYL